MIHIENVKKQYGNHKLLDGVSLDIHSGEIFGLLGTNGAGKSTLISILATVLKPTSGHILLNGLDIRNQTKQVRKMIGYVPQDVALWEELSVKENLSIWSKFVNGGKRISEQRLLEVCETVLLQDKWNVKVSKLSGGMKRKLNIAVALIHNPDILLMDEPTVGIDLQSKLEINRYVKDLAKQGKTIVYTTHDISEIMNLCDRIGVLRKGVMEFVGTIEEAAPGASIPAEDVIYQLLNE